MFRVYHSNQLDLLKTLITVLMAREPLSNPLQQEVVLVQSPGMAQWLQIELAAQFGVAAGLVFPLPATFIWDIFTRVLHGIPKESAFSKDAMTWKLMWLLPGFSDKPAFSPLQRYLSSDADRCKMYQLAARMADLFDQYLVYRPQWLKCWEHNQLVAGLDDAQQWQAPLWRALSEYTCELKQPLWHRANLYEQFTARLCQENVCTDRLPSRVFICGISALPPAYLQALQALGRHIDIHLMFTNPCRYFWGDIRNDAWIEQSLSNPLLASWGRQGRDHLYLLSQSDETEEIHAFVDILPDNLLHGIQHDMLELEDNSVTGRTTEALARSDTKRVLSLTDHSVSLHVCHSPLRETEVLHDQLLTMLSEDPQLTPRDIIVMVADIDNYAPYIQAVFASAPAERYLPFALSDRKACCVHPALQALITLLDLPQSRFTAQEVMALLELPVLARRFAINEAGVCRLRRWVEESGIRWGLDDDNVRELSLPVTGQHTWQFGLTRMFLGYAMDSGVGAWQGILPYDESSGLAAELAGQLAEFLMQLSLWRKQLAQPRALLQWLPVCRQLLETFFAADGETEQALELAEQQWQQIISYGIAAGYPDAVPLRLLRNALAERVDNERISQRFLAGAINFCTLMPMRSIPFKVVCLLGMNDGVYPRTVPAQSFDLMARKRQRGDRSRRDDDRYLFLEALLSAQHRLYISYIGRSVQDNSQRYPSLLVGELLDYIAHSYRLPADALLDAESSAQRVTEHLLCWHPRTAFAAENYVPGSRQQSYATEWLPAAQAAGYADTDFRQPLPAELSDLISLDRLMHFYRHPVRAFFQQRLGVHFVTEETTLPDEEPFAPDKLSCYQLNMQLLDELIRDELITGKDNVASVITRWRSSGRLPFGTFGEIFWQQQHREIDLLAERIRQHCTPGHSIELNVAVGDLTVTGWMHQVQMDGLLRWRPALLTAVDGLLLWLEHLVYCVAGGAGSSRMYGCKGTAWCFAPLSATEAISYLQPLIAGYQQGMCQPLLLLIKTGWAWLEHCYESHTGNILMDPVTQTKARAQLLKVWSNSHGFGEGADPYVRRILPVLNEADVNVILQETERYLLPVARHNRP